MKIVFGLMFMVLGLSVEAQAYDNRCGYYPEGNTSSLCKGMKIPFSKTRGRSSSALRCSGAVDNHQRHPEEIPNYDEWAKIVRMEGKQSQDAHALRASEPRIKWSGSIPFQVSEHWSWISCDLVTSASECGTHRECHTEYYTVNDCDRDNNCTSRSESREVCNDVANTCYADVKQTASHTCSVEKIDFTAEFLRDAKWNPSNPNYSEFIPNKYDLLPGEVELIQITSTSGGSTLQPSVDFGDAWNQYRPHLSGSVMGQACAQRSDFDLKVEIETERRLIKASPNAFRRPVRADGSPLPIFRYQPTSDRNGDPINGKPMMLRLADTSANLVNLMAKQSRDQGKREELKDELGLNGKPVESAERNADMQAFFKSTQLRVSLFENKWYGNSSFSPSIYMGDGEAVTSANYSLSKIAAIRNSEYWEIPLANGDSPEGNLYQNTAWLTRMLGVTTKALKPNQRYRLELSMFQKGVPFYKQLCGEDNPEKKECYKNLKDVFSKPIVVNFWTHPDFEERPWYVQVNDWTFADAMHRWFRSRPADDENTSTSPLIEKAANTKGD